MSRRVSRRFALGFGAVTAASLLVVPLASHAGATTTGPSAHAGLFGHSHRWGSAAPAEIAGGSSQLKTASLPGSLQVVATGLNQPHKLSFGPHGDLYVSEAGLNLAPASCLDGTQTSCETNSGGVAQVSLSGAVTQVVSGLPSISNGRDGPGAAGPVGVQVVNGRLQIIVQNTGINSHTGAEAYGPGGALLGDLVSVPASGGTPTAEASFGPYEAAHNPDHGAGSDPMGDPPIDSDPYAVVAYNGGWAVADAAGNDVLFVSQSGAISVLAVLPLLTEHVPAGVVGPNPVTLQAQPVPTSLAVGPDGALYIGELGGGAYDVDDTNVYRLAPGGALQVYASGFTMVGDIAFDQAGRLLVLTIDQAGLGDPMQGGLPSPGAITRVNEDGSRTVLASTGLLFPLGMAVGPDGSIYVSNFGVIQGTDDPDFPGFSGQIDRVADPVSADEIGANFGGYREVASDGGIFTFGALGFYGSQGGKPLNDPVVGSASTPTGPGYWEVASDGGIFTFGTAGFYGSEGGHVLNKPIVALAPTPDGRGYWEVASDGGIFTFGDAGFYGSEGGLPLNSPIVGISPTPDGAGYFLFAADGGVFTFGDAVFHGSEGGHALNSPIVSGAVAPDGGGYYLVAADGGVFTFGSARFFGSEGGHPLNAPVVGLRTTPNGAGYYLVAADGGVFTFGNAVLYGSEGGHPLNSPVVGVS